MPQGTPQSSPSAQPPRSDAPTGGHGDSNLESHDRPSEQPDGAGASPPAAIVPGVSFGIAPDMTPGTLPGAAPYAEALADQGTYRLPAARPASPASGASVGAAASPELYEEALIEAVTRVRADGGELVTYDPLLQSLVLRARLKHNPTAAPNTFLNRSGFGWAQPSQPSQPMLEEQPTVVLPAATAMHLFPPDAGVRGLAFTRRYPITLPSEEIDHPIQREDLPVPDASCVLAVPIFRPSTQGTLRPDPEVIGVLTVYNRTPMWTFSKADIDTLVLHADRIGRTIALVDATREKMQREALLELLRGSDGAPGEDDPPQLAARVREVARKLVPAAAFALVLVSPAIAPDPDVAYLGTVWEGKPVPSTVTPRRASELPAWWQEVSRGRTVRIATAEEAAQRQEACHPGWETPQPIHSLLVVPLLGGRGRRPLGALLVADTHLGVYGAHEAEVLRVLATETTLLIEQAQRGAEPARAIVPAATDDRQRQERAAQLAQFSNAVLTLNASLELDATADALVQQAAHFTSATARMVFLLDEEHQCLEGIATNWEPEGGETPFRDVRIPLSWQELGRLLREQPYTVLDHLDADWQRGEAGDSFAAHYQITSCLVLPMEQPEHQQEQITGTLHAATATLLGALFVFTPRQPYRATSKEIQLLQTLVSPASRAISNAQLFHNLEQAYEKQKELDRYKDDFILTVSHEFRTPMTTIEGYSGLIARHGAKLGPEKLDQFAHEIKLAVDQLAGMIGTLADVNRMDTEALEVKPSPVSARAAAQTALAQQPPEQQPRITIEVPEDVWVLADEERLPRVFGNLISNAIKYTETACRVTTRPATREELLSRGRELSSDAEEWVVIGVQDYGSGISSEDQARLFQKFVRLPHSRTTPIRGTGLGLWICREYVKAFGGDIWVESSLGHGHGSLFAFCLPVATPPSEE